MIIKPLDANNPVPLKTQTEMFLRRLILEKEYQEGVLLPDENTLAKQLGVSRGTVRAGLGRLVFEGLLERRPGIGTKVVKKKTESGIGAWRSLTREMEAKGIAVQTFSAVCKLAVPMKAVSLALGTDNDVPLYRLDRLRGWNDQPVLHSRSWFHPRLNLNEKVRFDKPLYEVLEDLSGVVADRAEEEFLAVAATPPLTSLLKVEAGTPLLLRRHIVNDRGNRPMEFAEVHYVSKLFSLTLDLHRDD